MKWGLDAAYPPSVEQALQQKLDGYQFFCGYIGGHAENIWLPQAWLDLAGLGFDLLPIWVAPLVNDAGYDQGVADGNSAAARMQELGMSGCFALDVENGLRPRQYSRGFLDACEAASVGVVLYGGRVTINAIGNLRWAAWWLAWYSDARTRYRTASPDWAMWQFATSDQVDFNVACDDFPFCAIEEPEAPSATPRAEA